jgi:hypothetical protein
VADSTPQFYRNNDPELRLRAGIKKKQGISALFFRFRVICNRYRGSDKRA